MILAIANMKGGVGKTTTAAALGQVWSEMGKRVLLVDLDPQASLTATLGYERDASLYRSLRAYAVDHSFIPFTVEANSSNLAFIPSHIELAALEMDLLGVEHGEQALDYVLFARDEIGPLDTIIDCPPSLSLLTANALVAADKVLIPVVCEYLATEGLTHMLATVKKIRRAFNPRLEIAGVLPTMMRAGTREHTDVLAEMRVWCEREKIPLLPYIPATIKVAEAVRRQMPLTKYAGTQAVAQAYRNVAQCLQPTPDERNVVNA